MPRAPRTIAGGMVYHVLNRGNLGQALFRNPAEFRGFEEILREGLERYPVDLLCYALSADQWQLVLRPRKGPALGKLLGWVGVTHARRHFSRNPKLGGGHLYQGRYKSFPVQEDKNFLTLCRYIESSPVRDRAARKAEKWEFSSLYHRTAAKGATGNGMPLAEWPVSLPKDWASRVNEPLSDKELQRIEISIKRGRPLGDDKWTAQTVRKLNLDHTIRNLGRPRKGEGKKR